MSARLHASCSTPTMPVGPSYARALETEAPHQLGIGRGARDTDGPGMGHVGKEGAERHDHLDLELLGNADDLGAERAPSQLRLDAEEHHCVALGAGQGRGHHLVGRPGDLAGDAVHQAHLRAGGREVVEVLGIEGGEGAPAQRSAR